MGHGSTQGCDCSVHKCPRYDAAGNITADSTTNLNYTFDAENRITGAAGYTYTCDAGGNRVEKSNGSTGTIYWYMTPGIVAESNLSGALTSEYIFFAGERVARKDFPGNAVSYYFSDHLKTASVVTNSSGAITEDEDYYPWGGELQFVNSDSNHYKFTGKERDGETGLDYFGARYYGNWYGRFLSADWSAKPEAVPYSDLHDPQSLNLYSYVRNVPTSRADADGHLSGEDHKPRGLKKAPGPPDTSTGVEGLCGFWCWVGSWFSNHVNTDSSPQYSGKNPIFSSDQLLENSAQQAGGALNTFTTGITIVDVTGLTSLNETMMTAALNGDWEGVAKAMTLIPLMFTPTGIETKEAVTVYRIMEADKVAYVGIMNNLERRSLEHGVPLEKIVTMGSRQDARAVEQALIEHYGMQKNGGQLLNKRSSIAPTTLGFWDKVKFGFEVLRGEGYIF